jgi:hypothetical protein
MLRVGIDSPPKTGRFYRLRGGKMHQASAPGEYPARRTGALSKSIRSHVGGAEATIGTTIFYGRFLRKGTSKMKRRKMSDTALATAVPVALKRAGRFARFRFG